MKGILLAGGAGTRLYPLTRCVGKQLLPVYDKPLVYYPLSILMLAGIREVAVVSSPRDLPILAALFGDGAELGLKLTYIEQARPEGIAQAFVLAEPFLAGDAVTLVLGDNIFYGNDLVEVVERACRACRGAEIFAYRVQDPERFGVVEFDKTGRVLSLEEKPQNPRTSWAVPGLYVYDADVFAVARELTPSTRGELEITDLNRVYMERGKLFVTALGRGIAWFDSGTYDSLLQASNFVQAIEQRQGLKVACLEEIAFTKGFISRAELASLAAAHGKSGYGDYLRQVVAEAAP